MKKALKLIIIFTSILSLTASAILLFAYIEDITKIVARIKEEIAARRALKRGEEIETK